MTKITVTIETEAGEDPRQKLMEFLAGGTLTNGAAAGVEWTQEDFAAFWAKVRPDAQKVLAIVAKQPDGCPMTTVEKALGWKGLQIAGRMSSVGHVMRKFPGRQWPYTWDWHQRVYKLANHKIAEWITKLANGRKAA
jgi:hypothetical protein